MARLTRRQALTLAAAAPVAAVLPTAPKATAGFVVVPCVPPYLTGWGLLAGITSAPGESDDAFRRRIIAALQYPPAPWQS